MSACLSSPWRCHGAAQLTCWHAKWRLLLFIPSLQSQPSPWLLTLSKIIPFVFNLMNDSSLYKLFWCYYTQLFSAPPPFWPTTPPVSPRPGRLYKRMVLVNVAGLVPPVGVYNSAGGFSKPRHLAWIFQSVGEERSPNSLIHKCTQQSPHGLLWGSGLFHF